MSQNESTPTDDTEAQPPTTVNLDDPSTLLSIAHNEAERALETGAFDQLSIALLLDSARAARDQMESPPTDIYTLINELEDALITDEDEDLDQIDANPELITAQAEAACDALKATSGA